MLLNLPKNGDLTSRLVLDARLYDPPPQRVAGTHGRPRKRGPRLPTPKQMLEKSTQRINLNLYGKKRSVHVAHAQARVYAAPDRPLRVVATDPISDRNTMKQAFYSTYAQATAQEVLTWYAIRW